MALALFGGRATAAGVEAPRFHQRTDFAAGGGPAAIAAGDFDGDGVVDLATANDFSEDLAVLLGEGGGAFSPGVRYAFGSPAGGLLSTATWDVDADGVTDVVITNQLGGTLVFLPGRGDGSFGEARSSPTGGVPVGLAMGDFDGDGNVDAVVAKPFDGAVTLLGGDGWGGFVPAGTFAVAGAGWALAAGDLDGDGRSDLAVGLHAETDGLAILRGDGRGGFDAVGTTELGKLFNPIAVILDDLDGDDRLDVAVANEGDDSVSILLGSGDGRLGAPRQYDVSAMPRGLAVGDFNRDGWPDLAASGRLFNQVSIIAGRGDGSFEPALDFETHAAPAGVVVGDFDGDGLTDLATANQESNDVSVLLNDSPVVLPCVGDCDGDGRVTVDELVRGVNLALEGSADPCPAFDFNGDGLVTVDELVRGVNAAVNGCG